MLLQMMARNWWTTVLRGVCAILFGLLAWLWPGVTLSALVLVWGAYAFADGVLAFASAFSDTNERPWWALVLTGLVSIGAALFAFFAPGLTAVGLLLVIAVWAMASGALAIVSAIRLRRDIEGEVWLGLAGVVSVLFGALLIARPAIGVLAVVWMIGAYAIVSGVLLIALGLEVKRIARVA